MQKVLIAGATGYLGGFVVQEFKKRGYWIRALVRNPDKLDGLSEFIDETIIGEITNPDALHGICKGIDIVFSSVGITKQKDNLTYMDVDYQGNMNILEEAEKENISKFIYISVFGVEKMEHLKCIQAKIKFEEALKKSGTDYAVIRPNGFFSDMLEYLKMAEKGRGYVIGSGENRINPIHGKDLAEVCADAAAGDAKEISVGGPEVLTHNEILETAFDCLDKTAKISRIPHWIAKLTVALLRRFTSVKTYGPVEFFINVLTEDMVAPAFGNRCLKDFFLENADSL
jgi:uncharacterized protein YbjT (DUF2867 family)